MEFLSVDEFAEKVRMCPQTIRKAIRKGKINAFRPGIGIKGPYRIPETEIDRILIITSSQRIEA